MTRIKAVTVRFLLLSFVSTRTRMTFGLLAPITQLNRAIRLVAVSSLLGNVINDSLPRVDFKTNLGGLQLAVKRGDTFAVSTTEVPPEVLKITHEIEDRLDEIHDSVRKHQTLLLEEKASKRTESPQLIQLQVVQPVPASHVQSFPSGQLQLQQQIQPQVQQPIQGPILMRLLASNTGSNGQVNQSPSSSVILLFQNSNDRQQLNGHFVSTSHLQQLQNGENQLLQQLVPVQTSQKRPQSISIENLTAALTHASFASPSIATGMISGQIEPRAKEAEEQKTDEGSEDEEGKEEPKEIEKKKRRTSKKKKSDED